MRHFLLDPIKHLAHHLLIQFESTDTLILTKEKVLGLPIDLPLVHCEHTVLQRGHIIEIGAAIDLVDLVVLGCLLGCFLAPVAGDQEVR